MRSGTLMPFLWMLKNVNIELFSFFVLFTRVSLLRSSIDDDGGFSTHFVYIVNATGETSWMFVYCTVFSIYPAYQTPVIATCLGVALHIRYFCYVHRK